mgnify:CR=1 FL=1
MKERIDKLIYDLQQLEINPNNINDKYKYYIDKLNEFVEYLKENNINSYFINYINQVHHLTEQMERTDNMENKHYELLKKRSNLIETLNNDFYRLYFLIIR